MSDIVLESGDCPSRMTWVPTCRTLISAPGNACLNPRLEVSGIERDPHQK